jgi:NAD(P)-dependent dehydrogenase (short-subunit alcohol dehydrogenase family)
MSAKMEILISGASTGIGRACAVHMAASGCSVWAGVRTEKSADEIKSMNVRGLQPLFLDVTDEASIAAAVSMVKKKAGMLHGLVNNAGIAVGGPIEGLATEDWRRQFDTNFFGLIELTRLCLPMLRESKGRIVNMSSLSGRIASPYLAPYAASKFALEAYSDSLRREVGKFGVQVCVVEPGPIDTPIWRKSINDGLKRNLKMPEDVKEVYGRSLEKFFKGLEKTVIAAAPVSLVVKAVDHALRARQPRTRYPVGRGIGLLTSVSNVMPDRLMDKLLRSRS